jgi:hypothetical protein
MGWIISVGTAGVKGKGGQGGQVLSLNLDARGVPARIRIFEDAGDTASRPAGMRPARQEQRIWRHVLATLTDTGTDTGTDSE